MTVTGLFRVLVLTIRLGDTRQLTLVSHVAEANAGDTELLEGAAGTAVDLVAVTQTDRGGVAGQLLQAEACSFAGFVRRVGVNQVFFSSRRLAA